jgi:hypothetical protein
MTYYNNTFDTSIQCEERAQVTPEEYDEVMQMMADEHDEAPDYEGYAEWSQSLEENEPVKDWLNGYSNIIEGDTYNGMDV